MQNSDFDKLQHEVGEWGNETFGSPNTYPKMQGLFEHLKTEIDELDEACLSFMANTGATSDDILLECADIVMMCIHLAHLFGLSLEDAVREKLEINKTRTWGEINEHGFREHIRWK